MLSTMKLVEKTIYGVCFLKKSLSPPSNTMHDTTIAVYEEKMTFNDNHHPKNMNKSLCLEPEEQHRALCYAYLCLANSSLAYL